MFAIFVMAVGFSLTILFPKTFRNNSLMIKKFTIKFIARLKKKKNISCLFYLNKTNEKLSSIQRNFVLCILKKHLLSKCIHLCMSSAHRWLHQYVKLSYYCIDFKSLINELFNMILSNYHFLFWFMRISYLSIYFSQKIILSWDFICVFFIYF